MDCRDLGYEYSDLEYLADLFDKTIDGTRFIAAATAAYPEKPEKDLELIWLAFKAMHNNK